MIGQRDLMTTIFDHIESGVYPRFSILVGPKGSGKKTLAGYVGEQLGGMINRVGIKVDDIRQMIDSAYKTNSDMPSVYIIEDADSMSAAAKNALLKVTEEPPNKSYFIMTLESADNTLATIRSRGTVYRMDPYKPEELVDYATSNKDLIAHEIELIADICETPGEVNTLLSMEMLKFYEYVELVVDSIADVSGSNSFKIADRISFKADDGKYDLKLFWKAFMKICVSRISDDPMRYAHGTQITSKYLQELRITGINKQSTFDMWIFSIREEWR